MGLFYPFILFLLTYIVSLQWFSRRSPLGLWWENEHIHKKALLTLWFWRTKNLANSRTSQKQSNGNAPLGVFYTIVCSYVISTCGNMVFIYISRGAFSVARFDLSGMREPLVRGTSKSAGSTFFLFMCDNVSFNFCVIGAITRFMCYG